jgi:DDE superfamily endonuclease
MAEAQAVSKNTVNRLWQLHNIKPHLSGTFKLSRDAKFLEKLTDVVGLYLNPPDKALVLLDGKVMGECHGRHRHQEWLKFLRRLDGEFPQALSLHLVMDTYGTHKEPHVQAWLKKHPRFVCHFVPTSSSWLNRVERWFRALTAKAIRRGSFVSVPDLKQAIDAFMHTWNLNPKPFLWTASVGQIIEKIERARAKMEQIKPGSTLPRGKRKVAHV